MAEKKERDEKGKGKKSNPTIIAAWIGLAGVIIAALAGVLNVILPMVLNDENHQKPLKPIAIDDTATTEDGKPIEIDLLVNDRNVDRESTALQLNTELTKGRVKPMERGWVHYTPPDDHTETDKFRYTIHGPDGKSSDAVVQIVIHSKEPDPTEPLVPIAADDYAETNEDEPIEFNVLENDLNVDIQKTVMRIDEKEAKGRIRALGKGMMRYTPPDNFNGPDVFRYIIQRVDGMQTDATVRIEVIPVNDPPIAPDLELEASYVLQPVLLVDLIGGATDVEGDAIELAGFKMVGNGSPPLYAKAWAEKIEPLMPDEKGIFMGHIALPIAGWGDEADKNEIVKGNLHRTVKYTLRDTQGATTAGMIDVTIQIPKVDRISFDCVDVYGGIPSKLTIEVFMKDDDSKVLGKKVVSIKDIERVRREDSTRRLALNWRATNLENHLDVLDLHKQCMIRSSWPESEAGYTWRINYEPTFHLDNGDKLSGTPLVFKPDNRLTCVKKLPSMLPQNHLALALAEYEKFCEKKH